MPTIGILFPVEKADELKQMAKRKQISRSQILLKAFDSYKLEEDRWETRRIGDRIAKELGIETDDDVERVFG